jgi:hypothetical protein
MSFTISKKQKREISPQLAEQKKERTTSSKGVESGLRAAVVSSNAINNGEDKLTSLVMRYNSTPSSNAHHILSEMELRRNTNEDL